MRSQGIFLVHENRELVKTVYGNHQIFTLYECPGRLHEGNAMIIIIMNFESMDPTTNPVVRPKLCGILLDHRDEYDEFILSSLLWLFLDDDHDEGI